MFVEKSRYGSKGELRKKVSRRSLAEEQTVDEPANKDARRGSKSKLKKRVPKRCLIDEPSWTDTHRIKVVARKRGREKGTRRNHDPLPLMNFQWLNPLVPTRVTGVLVPETTSLARKMLSSKKPRHKADYPVYPQSRNLGTLVNPGATKASRYSSGFLLQQ